MTRDIASIADNILDPVISIFFAIELMFDTETTIFNDEEIEVGPLHFWTGLGELTVDGITYTGSGSLLSIGEIPETAGISAAGTTLTLSGIPSDLIALALQTPYHGRPCRIKFGLLDENGNALNTSGDPASPALVTLFVGQIDQMNMDEGPDTSTITVAVESKMIKLNQPVVRRYTSESQKALYPDDLAFDYVEDLQDKPLTWGRSNEV